MKKTFLLGAAALFAACMSSCDMKLCYCYQQVGDVIVEDETYTDEANACNNLSTTYRHCVEDGQRLPAGGMAVDFKHSR